MNNFLKNIVKHCGVKTVWISKEFSTNIYKRLFEISKRFLYLIPLQDCLGNYALEMAHGQFMEKF